MPSLGAVALLVVGLALVVGGAEIFFEGLVSSAWRFRLSPFALTVLVSGFELENLAAGIAINVHGLPDAAAGTFLGGTTFLALGVAGVSALIAPMEAALPNPVLAWTAASPLPLLALSLDGTLSRVDGALLVVWFVVAMWGLWRTGRSVLGDRGGLKATRHPVLGVVAGLALLTVGGDVLGRAIREVVHHLGVSPALLGNTVVAAGVEAEEIGRVVVPARRGSPEVALGNVIGTIVHFTALNAGAIALVRPLELGPVTLHLHLPVAVAATLVFCGVLAIRRGIGRAEGASLLFLYGAYIAAAIAAGS